MSLSCARLTLARDARQPHGSDTMSEQKDENSSKNIAMLIDGDNAQPSLIEEILSEAGKYGNVTVRRIYGDWTQSSMSSWKEYLHKHAIQPIQQFRYTRGKNATDSALIIDAMDVLYAGHIDGFCIVSSDSDYTKLATRIRESGLFVMGIGRKDTPESFVKGVRNFHIHREPGTRRGRGGRGKSRRQVPSGPASRPERWRPPSEEEDRQARYYLVNEGLRDGISQGRRLGRHVQHGQQPVQDRAQLRLA